jgi:hypothetical protein
VWANVAARQGEGGVRATDKWAYHGTRVRSGQVNRSSPVRGKNDFEIL